MKAEAANAFIGLLAHRLTSSLKTAFILQNVLEHLKSLNLRVMPLSAAEKQKLYFLLLILMRVWDLIVYSMDICFIH